SRHCRSLSTHYQTAAAVLGAVSASRNPPPHPAQVSSVWQKIEGSWKAGSENRLSGRLTSLALSSRRNTARRSHGPARRPAPMPIIVGRLGSAGGNETNLSSLKRSLLTANELAGTEFPYFAVRIGVG